jgi:hypothetical protein
MSANDELLAAGIAVTDLEIGAEGYFFNEPIKLTSAQAEQAKIILAPYVAACPKTPSITERMEAAEMVITILTEV